MVRLQTKAVAMTSDFFFIVLFNWTIVDNHYGKFIDINI